jgi:hypothetical protein
MSEHTNDPGPMGATPAQRFDQEHHMGGPMQGLDDGGGAGGATDGTGAGLGTRRQYRESLKKSEGSDR